MPDKICLVPAPELTVRDPITGRPLPKEGAMKPLSPYWRRQIAAGSVTEKTAAPAKKKEKEG
ncbi:DUF2635 domain-containing protein [Desulfarculus baarsii]